MSQAVQKRKGGGVIVVGNTRLATFNIEFDAQGELVGEPQCTVYPPSEQTAFERDRAAICRACDIADCPMRNYKPCHANAIRARPNAQCPEGKWASL